VREQLTGSRGVSTGEAAGTSRAGQAEHSGTPEGAPARDIARQVRHSAPPVRTAPPGGCRKASHLDSLTFGIRSRRGAEPLRQILQFLNRPVGTPGRDPGGSEPEGKCSSGPRATAPETRGHEPVSTPGSDRPHFLHLALSVLVCSGRPGMGYGGARSYRFGIPLASGSFRP